MDHLGIERYQKNKRFVELAIFDFLGLLDLRVRGEDILFLSYMIISIDTSLLRNESS